MARIRRTKPSVVSMSQPTVKANVCRTKHTPTRSLSTYTVSRINQLVRNLAKELGIDGAIPEDLQEWITRYSISNPKLERLMSGVDEDMLLTRLTNIINLCCNTKDAEAEQAAHTTLTGQGTITIDSLPWESGSRTRRAAASVRGGTINIDIDFATAELTIANRLSAAATADGRPEGMPLLNDCVISVNVNLSKVNTYKKDGKTIFECIAVPDVTIHKTIGIDKNIRKYLSNKIDATTELRHVIASVDRPYATTIKTGITPHKTLRVEFSSEYFSAESAINFMDQLKETSFPYLSAYAQLIGKVHKANVVYSVQDQIVDENQHRNCRNSKKNKRNKNKTSSAVEAAKNQIAKCLVNYMVEQDAEVAKSFITPDVDKFIAGVIDNTLTGDNQLFRLLSLPIEEGLVELSTPHRVKLHTMAANRNSSLKEIEARAFAACGTLHTSLGISAAAAAASFKQVAEALTRQKIQRG